MFNFSLFFIIILISIPGVWLMSSQSSKMLSDKPENKSTSIRSLFILILVQTFILVVLASAAGVHFGSKVGFSDPFIKGLTNNELNIKSLLDQIVWGVVGGVICSLVWIISYYAIIRPNLDVKTVQISEKLRDQMGFWTRIASGGIVEEVLFRWGLLSVVMWGMLFIIESSFLAFALSLLLTGILFGLLHIPGNIQEGCKPSLLFVSAALLGNLWVSLFCGYLFWRYGILSAFIVHMMFHILWYPLEKKKFKQDLKAIQSNIS